MSRTRDELAEEILLAILRANPVDPVNWGVRACSTDVYAFADAMIAQRKLDTRSMTDTNLEQRKKVLDELTALSQEMGLYD